MHGGGDLEKDLRKHDSRASEHGGKLRKRLAKLLALFGASLEELGNDGHGADIQESAGSEGEQQVSRLQTRAKQPRAIDLGRCNVTIGGVVRELYGKGGMRAFFPGFGPALARAVPANAATFLGVELAHQAMNKAFG